MSFHRRDNNVHISGLILRSRIRSAFHPRQSLFFRSAQCQIVYKFAENTVQRKSFAIPTTLSAAVPRQIVKKIFAERKREEKNANVRSLPRFARYNDARVNAFVRPLLRLSSMAIERRSLFFRNKASKKKEPEFLHPSERQS